MDKPQRHPLFGPLKGWITIAPGVDLTDPADPEWGEVIWGERDREDLVGDDRANRG